MKHILFIHGAYHSGWCWEPVVRLLPKDVFQCHAIDLPGQGANKILPKQYVTPKDYLDFVLSYIEIHNLTDITLVSHSMGGIVLGKLVEQIPFKIKSAFLLTSVLLNGKSFMEMLPLEVQKKYREIASHREDMSIPPNLERIRAILFNQSKDSETLNIFLRKLEPQPISIYEEKVTLSAFKHTSVAITYIKCKNDISLPVAGFEEILSNLPTTAHITEIDADHEAMLSNPKAIANLLS